jgi:hypothetical protein
MKMAAAMGIMMMMVRRRRRLTVIEAMGREVIAALRVAWICLLMMMAMLLIVAFQDGALKVVRQGRRQGKGSAAQAPGARS